MDLPGTLEERIINIKKFEVKATWSEARQYDFNKLRGEDRKTINVLEAIGHLTKSCFGGGLVAIHESYKNCGLWMALALNILLGLGVTYCMLLLAQSAQKIYGRVQVPKMSYPDLAQASLEAGPWPQLKTRAMTFRYAVDVIMIINLFGSCCIYQVVMARTIKQLVDNSDTVSDDGNPPIRIYVLCIMVPCMLLCMVRSLKYLAPFSIASDAFFMVVAVSTVYYAIKAITINPLQFPTFHTFTGLFEFMGVCVFSMEGICATLAIENNMENPKKINIVLFAGMSLVVGLVICVGFFGYWGFGEAAKSPVTINFPMDVFATVLKIFMAVMMWVTYALYFWVPFELVWHHLQQRYPSSKYWLWERVYRAIFVAMITLIATILPNVSKFIGIIGSFCLSALGFIFPAFIDLSLNWEEPGLGFMKWRFGKFVIIFAFGIILCLFGTIINAKELIIEVYIDPQ